MSLPPVEIPLGAMRFNSDSQKLEYWNGQIWMQIHTFSPNLDGGARAVFGGSYSYGPGGSYPKTNIIDYITIATAGNAIDFGDLTETRGVGAGGASRTRGLFCGGQIKPAAAKTSNVVDYITISSTGNAADFGDLTVKGSAGIAGMSNQTRMVCAGRNTQDPAFGVDVNTIDYATIASTGNFVDFGDMVDATGGSAPIYGVSGSGNGVRGIISGGDEGPAYDPTIKFITMATLGNSQDFGEQTQSTSGTGSCSSSTRTLISSGATPGIKNLIDMVTIATTGNAVDFAANNFTTQHRFPEAVSDCVRAVFSGGYGAGPTYTVSTDIDYTNFSSGGNCVDFGDLTAGAANHKGASNGHGGLG